MLMNRTYGFSGQWPEQVDGIFSCPFMLFSEG
jgi:hypothetical protein